MMALGIIGLGLAFIGACLVSEEIARISEEEAREADAHGVPHGDSFPVFPTSHESPFKRGGQ